MLSSTVNYLENGCKIKKKLKSAKNMNKLFENNLNLLPKINSSLCEDQI